MSVKDKTAGGVAQTVRRSRDEAERQQTIEDQFKNFSDWMDWLQDNESATCDKLTLIGVGIFPAIRPTDTKSGSHTLPVARIPLASINTRWIVSGDTIRGSVVPVRL